jgi:protease-4
MDSQRSVFKRTFLAAWRVVDGARKLVLNLVFFFLLYLVIAGLLDFEETLIIQPNTALVLQPQGDVVEEYSGTPLDFALQQATEAVRTETRLRDLTDAVRRAADDPRIVRLVIDTDYLGEVGLASLQELDAAIAEFRAAGKPVVALADTLDQKQYYLAALADEIWLNPMGVVWIDGFANYRNFYAEGLDKLEVEVNLFRVGKYKSAMEPFVRNDMSPEAREDSLMWIGNLWQQYLETISRHRGIPLEDLSTAIADFADRLEAVDGDFARFALELGLVDRLMSRPEAHLALAQQGAPGSGSEGFRQVGFEHYLGLTDLKQGTGAGAKVAIVVAEGEIVRGVQPQGLIGAATLSEKLQAVSEDRDVKAVVLRVNSPGGDAFAAEKIRHEIQALKELGKTVVVSMGNVAASGGYWIAMGADEIWASPTTITGSIGVFGILPTFARPLEKLGIHSDGVGTTPLAGKLRLDRPLDPDLRRIFQHAAERTYEDFVTLVSESRQMSPEAVLEVAQGRVWTGTQAKDRGLVDQTGTLQEAIDAAARIAGLGSDYEAVYEERELTPFESFLIDITGNTLAGLDFGSGFGRSGLPALPGTLLDSIARDLAVLARSSDGGPAVVAHCLCGVD